MKSFKPFKIKGEAKRRKKMPAQGNNKNHLFVITCIWLEWQQQQQKVKKEKEKENHQRQQKRKINILCMLIIALT